MSLLVFYTIITVPIFFVFNENFYGSPHHKVNWIAVNLFVEIIWALAFFINMNRVDPALKIFTLKDSFKAYLFSPLLIPDLVILVLSVMYTIMRNHHYAKAVQLFRILLNWKKILFPINLAVEYFNTLG
jgi:hypothetical protein